MKLTNLFLRLSCLILALVTVGLLAVGCGNTFSENPEASNSGQDGAGTEATPTGKYDSEGYLMDEIPDGLNFNQSVRIVISESQKNQVAPSEDSTDVISAAIVDRNLTVEDRLGIEIEFLPIAAGWNDRATFCQTIKAASQAGDAYDALCVYNPFPGALASAGLLENLGDTQYIDLNGPWWPSSFTSEVVIDNTLFSLVESSSKGTLRNMHGVFFNNALIEDLNLESPYDLVAKNEWTFANMMALIKDTWSDKNNNGVKDKDDSFGVVTGTQAKIESWFFGMGYKYCIKNENGELDLKMRDVYYMVEWIDVFTAAAATNDFLLYEQNGHTKTFFSNNAVLYMTSLQLVENGINNGIEFDYGVVPIPKKDENQERYLTNIANSHDSWCIPMNVKNIDLSSAILECMASEAYRQIAPVYFEQCIKLRYAPDERLAEMYDLIRDGIVFDFTSIFSFSFEKDPRSILHATVKNPQNLPWPSQWESNGPLFENGFAAILELYQSK